MIKIKKAIVDLRESAKRLFFLTALYFFENNEERRCGVRRAKMKFM